MQISRIISFGVDNPLVLGMGHQVADRMKRLSTKPRFRRGGFAATLLVCFSLGITSVAKQVVPYSLHELAPIFTSDKGSVIQGVPFLVSYTNANTMRTEMAYEVKGRYVAHLHRGHDNFETDPETNFNMPFLNECIDHLYGRQLGVLWYERQGKILKSDEPGETYIISCIPGNQDVLKTLTKVNVETSVAEAKLLSAGNRENLQIHLTKIGGLNALLSPQMVMARQQILETLRADPDISESAINEFLTVMDTEAFTRKVKRKVRMIDPSLSEEERQKVLKQIRNQPLVTRTIRFEAGTTDEEKQKPFEKLEEEALIPGMILVNQDEVFEKLEVE